MSHLLPHLLNGQSSRENPHGRQEAAKRGHPVVDDPSACGHPSGTLTHSNNIAAVTAAQVAQQ
jgi:hypothetical protein